ncbi:MAG: CHASE2 domain-containing protein [Neptuniibacter sp.]
MLVRDTPSEFKVCSVIYGLFLFIGMLLIYFPLFFKFDNMWSDYLIRERAQTNEAPNNIVIVDIDDVSLEAMSPLAGNWPWPRAVHAELVDLIQNQKPQAVVFDIFFADKDIFNPDSDHYFSEILALHSNNTYLPILHFSTDSDSLFPRLDQYSEAVPVLKPERANIAPHAGLLLPEAIDETAWNLGVINFYLDSDGVGRRYSAVHRVGDWGLYSLPAVIAKDLSGFKAEQDIYTLDWYKGIPPFERISYYQLYKSLTEGGQYGEEMFFKDKIVIIGATAAGLHDIHSSPISSSYPGVYILATAIDNFMNDRFLKTLPHHVLGVVFSSLLLVLFIVLSQIKRLWVALLTLTGISVLVLLLGFIAVYYFAHIMPVISWVIIFILAFSVLFFYRFIKAQQEIKHTVSVFGRFLDPKVVAVLLKQGITEDTLKGKHTRVTILFTDIREFTQLSEYRSATEIVDLLNHYFSNQVDIIFKHKGTLDKFIGDSIMAFWGQPVEAPNQEIDAVSAALDMVEALKDFRREFGLFDFDIGIGIHTGEVVVGAIGTSSRYDYTAVGDAVNLASRIEGLTKETGARVLVSEETRNACGEAFDFERIGDYKVKGRQELVTIYQPRRLSFD